MIKFEHTVTPSPEQLMFVIEGMRNPMESWDQSDSGWIFTTDTDDIFTKRSFKLGTNDRDLMKRLCKAGSDERKFMRQMPVMVRITAPLYWWKEFDTYKVGTVANSCSTMHKIHAKEFTLDDFSHEHLTEQSRSILEDTINLLNIHRVLFVSKNDKRVDANTIMSDDCYAKYKKDLWWQMIQLLPSSYNQTRNITLNYEVLHNMYHARKHHKQDEWRVGFCDWCKSLPYSELITEEWEESNE